MEKINVNIGGVVCPAYVRKPVKASPEEFLRTKERIMQVDFEGQSHRDVKTLRLPREWELFWLKEGGLQSRTPLIAKREEVKEAIRNFHSPRNIAGGRACQVSLTGTNTILCQVQPGYGVAGLLENVEEPDLSVLLLQ